MKRGLAYLFEYDLSRTVEEKTIGRSGSSLDPQRAARRDRIRAVAREISNRKDGGGARRVGPIAQRDAIAGGASLRPLGPATMKGGGKIRGQWAGQKGEQMRRGPVMEMRGPPDNASRGSQGGPGRAPRIHNLPRRLYGRVHNDPNMFSV